MDPRDLPVMMDLPDLREYPVTGAPLVQLANEAKKVPLATPGHPDRRDSRGQSALPGHRDLREKPDRLVRQGLMGKAALKATPDRQALLVHRAPKEKQERKVYRAKQDRLVLPDQPGAGLDRFQPSILRKLPVQERPFPGSANLNDGYDR